MKDQKSKWPRGKMLGGSSGLNYLFYVRGDPRDFNYWQEDLGLEGLIIQPEKNQRQTTKFFTVHPRSE